MVAVLLLFAVASTIADPQEGATADVTPAASDSDVLLVAEPRGSTADAVSSVRYVLPGEHSTARMDVASDTGSFRYMYKVSDPTRGNLQGKVELSDGPTGNVDGEYRVLLSDGRTQVVRYSEVKRTLRDSLINVMFVLVGTLPATGLAS